MTVSASTDDDTDTVAAQPTDPYLDWARLTDFRHLDDRVSLRDWMPVIVEVAAGTTAAAFAAGISKQSGAADWIRIPALYAAPPAGLEAATFLTAVVTERFFEACEAGRLPQVERFEICGSVRSGHDADRVQWPPHRLVRQSCPLEAPPSGDAPGPVVVAVFDDDIAFAHPRFLDAAGRSRIAYFWDQSGGQPPEDVIDMGYGCELTAARIDALRQAHGPDGSGVEDRLYRARGQRRLLRRWGHGTHVLDLAAGWSIGDAGEPLAIIAVQRARRRIADTTGKTVPLLALDALRYVLDRVDRLACVGNRPRSPVVFNMSIGVSAGPHDGSSMLEAALAELVRLRERASPRAPLVVVMAAGNQHLDDIHAVLEVAPGAAAQLQVRIPPDHSLPSFVELWARGEVGTDAVRVELEPPPGPIGGGIAVGRGAEAAIRANGRAVASLVFPRHSATGRGPRGAMALVAVSPTVVLDPQQPRAPAGRWTIRVRNEGRCSFVMDAWIQRADTLGGEPRRGRQPAFDDPAFRRVDAAGRAVTDPVHRTNGLDRQHTMNGWGTHGSILAVGGYVGLSGAVSEYSGSGGDGIPGSSAPAVLAVSDDGVATRGVMAAGLRGGAVVSAGGTSVAAPQAARRIATLLASAAGDEGSSMRDRIIAAARADEASCPFPRPAPDRRRGEQRLRSSARRAGRRGRSR